MADGLTVKVEGLESLLKTLKRIEPQLAERGLRQAVGAVASEGRKLTRQNLAPHKRTGNLARSVRTSTRINRRQKMVLGKFGYRQRRRARQGWTLNQIEREANRADGFYGRFLEEGTRYITNPPRPLLRAAQALTPVAVPIMRNKIRQNLDKAVAAARRGTQR